MSKAAGTSGKITSSYWVWHLAEDLVRLASVKWWHRSLTTVGWGSVGKELGRLAWTVILRGLAVMSRMIVGGVLFLF